MKLLSNVANRVYFSGVKVSLEKKRKNKEEEKEVKKFVGMAWNARNHSIHGSRITFLRWQ